MKKLISNYTFDASAQTVTSSEFLDVREIALITNVTANTVIYNFADPAKGGTFAGKTLTLDYDTTAMADTDKLQIIAHKGTSTIKWSFAKVVAANGVDTDYGVLRQTGAGMAVSQTGGNLVITTGTTAYSETIIRTNNTFSGSFIARYGLTLSQRIANQNFVVELVDVIGDGLSMTINSTTSVTVTKTAHGFTSGDIGKGIWISQISVASCLTQRAVIASIPTADTITLTVVAFPASGSGTCSLVGYNFYNAIYSGTTATALGTGFNTQRMGWQNTATNATINTTASGHIGIVDNPRCVDVTYLDQIAATGTGVQATPRAVANQNVPDEDTQLYFQIRVFNGSSAPASTTTATFSFLDIQMYELNYTALGGSAAMGYKNATPVAVQTMPTTTVTMTSTTLTAVTPGTTAANLGKARDSAIGATDTGVAILGVRRDSPTAETPAAGDYVVPQISNLGAQYVHPVAHTAGGATPYKLISAATTNATSVKASAGQVYSIVATNTNAAARYLKLYNKASAPTVGTDVPVQVYMLPAGGGVSITLPVGMIFATGVALATTTGSADSDTGAVALGEIVINMTYL